jgi:hypothetical protein
MLPANLINALQALSRSDKPLIQATADTPKNKPNLQIGQEVQGTIQSKVNESLFKVQVAGQSLQMKLPDALQAGDMVRLQVASLNPRLTFNIIASQNPISTSDKIGSAAKLIANLAEQPLERPAVRHAEHSAVWPTVDQPPAPKQLASALREALANSGLFYESHQAQRVRGERSTTQLLVEPKPAHRKTKHRRFTGSGHEAKPAQTNDTHPSEPARYRSKILWLTRRAMLPPRLCAHRPTACRRSPARSARSVTTGTTAVAYAGNTPSGLGRTSLAGAGNGMGNSGATRTRPARR